MYNYESLQIPNCNLMFNRPDETENVNRFIDRFWQIARRDNRYLMIKKVDFDVLILYLIQSYLLKFGNFESEVVILTPKFRGKNLVCWEHPSTTLRMTDEI